MLAIQLMWMELHRLGGKMGKIRVDLAFISFCGPFPLLAAAFVRNV
jgi:hypothetical protein